MRERGGRRTLALLAMIAGSTWASEPAKSVAWLDDGSLLLLGSRLEQLASPRALVRTLPIETDLDDLPVSSNRRYFVTARRNLVDVRRAGSLSSVASIQIASGFVRTAAVDDLGVRLAIQSGLRVLELVHLTRAMRVVIDSPCAVSQLAWAAATLWVRCGDGDQRALAFDEDGRLRATLTLHASPKVLSTGPARVLIVDEDGEATIVDASGAAQSTLQLAATVGSVSAAAVNAAGDVAASGTSGTALWHSGVVSSVWPESQTPVSFDPSGVLLIAAKDTRHAMFLGPRGLCSLSLEAPVGLACPDGVPTPLAPLDLRALTQPDAEPRAGEVVPQRAHTLPIALLDATSGVLVSAAAQGQRGELKVWDLPANRLLWEAAVPARAVALEPNEKRLALVVQQQGVRVHDARSGALLQDVAEMHTASLAWLGDAELLMVGPSGLKLWRGSPLVPSVERAMPLAGVAALTVDRVRKAAAVGHGHMVTVASFPLSDTSAVIEFDAGAPVTALALTSSRVLVGTATGAITLWTLNPKPRLLANWKSATGGFPLPVVSLAMTDRTAVASLEGNQLLQLDVLSAAPTASRVLEGTGGPVIAHHEGGLMWVAGTDGVIRALKVDSAQTAAALGSPLAEARRVWFSRTSDQLVFEGPRGDTAAWNPTTVDRLHVFRARGRAVPQEDGGACAARQEGTSLSLTDIDKGTTEIFSVRDEPIRSLLVADSNLLVQQGERWAVVERASRAVRDLSWPSGTRVRSVNRDGSLALLEHNGLWSLVTLSPKPPARLVGVSTATFSANGEQVAAIRDGSLVVLDARSGVERHLVRGLLKDVVTLAWSSSNALALATASGELILLEQGRLIALEGHAAAITGLSWSRDGKTLASTSDDRTVKLWRDSRLLALLLSPGWPELLVIHPSGRFVATRGSLRALGFRRDGHAFGVEKFEVALNRPDVVLARLGWASPQLIESLHRAFERRLVDLGMSERELSFDHHGPTLEVKPGPAITRAASIDFQVRARDERTTLRSLQVSVNDTPVVNADLAQRQLDRRVTLALSSGRNEVSVTVVNAEGVSSLVQRFDVFREGAPRERVLYVAALGVSAYADASRRLQFASKDALDFVTALSAENRHYARVETLLLRDEEVSREALEQVRRFFSRASVDDANVLFVAGHGLLNSRLDYVFATAATNFDDPDSTTVHMNELENVVARGAARRRLLIIDSCHSAGLTTSERETLRPTEAVAQPGARGLGLARAPATELGALFVDLRRDRGVTLVASASGTQAAFESKEWGNGAFTSAFVELLRDPASDLDGDGLIELGELSMLVETRVREFTKGRQIPTTRGESVAFDFVLR